MASVQELLNLMRQRRELSLSQNSALKRQEQYQQQASQAQNTVGGGGYTSTVNGKRLDIPAPVQVDWGGLASKGINSYLAAKEGKKATDLARQADELNMQFFTNVMGDDPEIQRLAIAAQAGIPGADKALANKVAPKKQSLAVLSQFISGGGDPAMAAELANQLGIDPELASRAAEYQAQAAEQKENRRFEQQKYLKYLGASLKGSDRKEPSFTEYMQMSPEEQEAYRQYKGRKGSNTIDNLTPGERQIRGKSMEKLDDKIMSMEKQIQKFDNLRSRLDTEDTFGPRQKLADLLANSGNSVLSGIGTSMRSETALLLEDYLNDVVLDRMAALSGNDSNEELRRMRASLPQVMNDKEAALALMDQIDKWQRRTLRAIKMQRRELKAGRFFDINDEMPDYYKMAGEEPEPAQATPKGKIKILSIE